MHQPIKRGLLRSPHNETQHQILSHVWDELRSGYALYLGSTLHDDNSETLDLEILPSINNDLASGQQEADKATTAEFELTLCLYGVEATTLTITPTRDRGNAFTISDSLRTSISGAR